MRIHELKKPEGSTKAPKRIGRGRLGFEGGQMPLYRRLPKRGFNNKWAKEYAEVNVKDLNRFENGTVVDLALLLETGLVGKALDGVKILGNGDLEKKLTVKKALDGVKVLGNGELEKKLTVKAEKFSKSAAEKIEKAGGKAEVI